MTEEWKICPKCKKHYFGYGSISREDNKTEICNNCGRSEALEDWFKYQMHIRTEAKNTDDE